MTGKLRLEDLQRVVDCGNDNCSCSEFPQPVSIADWVEVGRQLGAEIREATVNEQFYDEWACLPVEWPGSYLIFRLPVESPTPKEGEQ